MRQQKLRDALEAFIAEAQQFREAIAKSTRAGHGGGCYTVELFPNGRSRLNWSGNIGNKYISPGVILDIPTLPDGTYEDTDEWEEALWFYAEEYANYLRKKLNDVLEYAIAAAKGEA